MRAPTIYLYLIADVGAQKQEVLENGERKKKMKSEERKSKAEKEDDDDDDFVDTWEYPYEVLLAVQGGYNVKPEKCGKATLEEIQDGLKTMKLPGIT